MWKWTIIIVLCLVTGCENGQKQQARAELEHQYEVDRILSRVTALRKTLVEQGIENTRPYVAYPAYYPPIYLPPTGPSSDEIAMNWIQQQQADRRFRQQKRDWDLYQLNTMNSLNSINSNLERLRWQQWNEDFSRQLENMGQ